MTTTVPVPTADVDDVDNNQPPDPGRPLVGKLASTKPSATLPSSRSYPDTERAARAFRNQRGPVGPLLIDPDGQLALDYGVRGSPETFFGRP